MSLSEDDVRKIAFLARIRVPDDRLSPLADELNNIVGWVEQLGEVNTEGVAPMTSVVETETPMRDDVVNDGEMVDRVLSNAPRPRRCILYRAEGGGMSTLTDWTIASAAAALESGEVSARELTDAHIARRRGRTNAERVHYRDTRYRSGARRRLRCAARQRRSGGADGRHSDRHEGPVLYRRGADHGGVAHP